jgi:peptidase M23-like protein
MRVSIVTALLLALFFLVAPRAAGAWRSPVTGPVARVFDRGANPYAGGHHRGVDLLAPPGSPVRAACAGRVVVAGRVGLSGGVVTVLCGRWRVSVMPLATIGVRRGTVVAPGARLGTLARSPGHAGLHFGVRRDGARFGYVDPLRFLAPSHPAAPPPLPLGRAPHTPHARTRHLPPLPLGRAPRALRARTRHLPPLTLAPTPAITARAIAATAPLAPWPAWAGLALVLAGLGVRLGTRRRAERRLGAALHDRPTAAG